MLRFGYDVPSGVVIGEISTAKYYTFHNLSGDIFASGDFETDTDAENYVKTKWPLKYADTVEMRCYNT